MPLSISVTATTAYFLAIRVKQEVFFAAFLSYVRTALFINSCMASEEITFPFEKKNYQAGIQ